MSILIRRPHFGLSIISLWLTLSLSLFLPSTHTCAQSSIIEKINTTNQNIHRDTRARDHLMLALKNSELKAIGLQSKIKQLNNQLQQQSLSINELKKKQTKYQQQLQKYIQNLKNNLNALYILHHQPAIKLLLSHKAGDTTSRMLTYYQYFNQARINNVTKIRTTLQQIQANKKLLNQGLSHLKTAQSLNQRQKNELRQKHHQRITLLNTIDAKLKDHKNKLASLSAQRQQLNNAVRQLEPNSNSSQTATFATLKGTLAWPVKGKLRTHFGDTILQSQLHQSGVIIATRKGQPIRAIAKGKIIFAKWLFGYGQLLIISHGSGYMTLYGHIQSIMKKIGDVVKPGDIIATTGNTGGNIKPGLYFAIRHKSTALNPMHWCTKRTS